jgi:hypothetical protein
MPKSLAIPLALLLALPALPVAANSTTHADGSSNHHFAVRHNAERHVVRQFRLTLLPELARLHRFAVDNVGRPGFFGRRGLFGGNGFASGTFYGGSGYDFGGFPYYPSAIDGQPQVFAMAAPPSPRIGDDRATMETTANGVTIIRGPGSHHR